MHELEVFHYEGIDSSENLIAGTIEAESQYDAIQRLNTRGITATEIEPENGWMKFKKRLEFSKSALSKRETWEFFKEFLSVIKTGLSPLEAFEYMSQNSEDNPKFAKLSLDAYQAINYGAELTEALMQCGIERKYCDVIKVGSSSGNLAIALESEIEQIELEIKIAKGFNSIYAAPAVTAFFMLIVTIGAIIWLVPMQEKLIYSLATNEEDIPLMSSMAFLIGDYGIQAIIGFILFVILFIAGKRFLTMTSHRAALFFDEKALKIPVFGSFYRNREFAKTCSMFMLALATGDKQADVIRLIMDQTNSVSYKERLKRAYQLVEHEGYLISDALNEIGFNGLITAFMRRGERTDRHEAVEMMKSLSKEFSEKSLYNMDVLKGASEMINMIMLGILSMPVLIISVGPSIDQITLAMSRF